MTASLPSHYNWSLVLLSIGIAVCSAFVALKVSSRMAAIRRKSLRWIWWAGGAVAMGSGVWAMHYIGMLAFSLPVPVTYDIPTVGFSLFAAIFASATALFLVDRETLGPVPLACGSLVMGSGICAMHYVGMTAMRLKAHCHYDLRLVALSVLVAVSVSGVALLLTFKLRRRRTSFWVEPATAILMGAAVCAMHYTGMAAVCFHAAASTGDLRHAVAVSSLGIAVVTIASLFILALTIVLSFADRWVTEQRNALAATQQEYQLVLERNLAGVCRISIEGTVLAANDAAARLLGFHGASELIGAQIMDHYLNPRDGRRAMAELRRCGSVNSREVCLKRTDGGQQWVIYNLSITTPLAYEAPEIVASAMGIAAIKETQQALVVAKEQAETANRAKSQFLANISHELRTPLNGILGMSRIALDSPVTDEVRECLEAVVFSADTLMSTINDVLDFSKIEARKLELDIHEFQLLEVVEGAQLIVESQARYKGLRLETYVSQPVPSRLLGDSGKIRQVLVNLLGNSIKFTSKGEVGLTVSRVEIEEDSNTAVLQLSVHDTGIGIPTEKLDVIFDAFAQADTSSSRRFGGTGLGLTICSELVEAMGGRIWAESTLGEGSTFHFTLRVGIAPRVAALAAALEASSADFVSC
jgi:two-component system, sensor histidine kinase and response regulator